MKKLTLFASAIVAVLAVSSCSNDEQATVETPTVKGVPFTVNVVNNGEGSGTTRGTDIATITNFKLNATYNSVNWIPNYNFSKPADSWVTEDVTNLTWPATVGTETHTFYAVCDNTTTPPDITAGKFDYTVPATIAAQKDLLVAAVTDAPNETPVELTFKHALSSVKFKIGYDADFHDGVMDENFKAFVRKITLYHIPTNGTFDFAKIAATDNSQWTVSSTDPGYVNIAITLNQEYEFTPIQPNAPAGNKKAKFRNMLTALSTDYISEPIFVLPNLPTPWEPGEAAPYTALENSYIGVELLLYDLEEQDYVTAEDWNTEDEDEVEEYKSKYTSRGGTLSTETDAWMHDFQVTIKVPTQVPTGYSASTLPKFLSGVNTHKSELFQEVYCPLKMQNGFGFNKTNIITISCEQMRLANGANVIQGIAFEIN